ncbi:hypothetical protein LguiA_008423 [Lonicera macranthoides]
MMRLRRAKIVGGKSTIALLSVVNPEGISALDPHNWYQRRSRVRYLGRAIVGGGIVGGKSTIEILSVVNPEGISGVQSELEKAISESKISIIVISKDYASSTWCLDELVMILEKGRNSGQIVLPMFYNVDPSQVRTQTGRTAKAFARYKKQFAAKTDSEGKRKLMEKIKRWR